MAQIKIYGLAAQLAPVQKQLSDVIHGCIVEALGMPLDKRFHRFIRLEPEDFIYPPGRSARYLILEISMFEGRSVDAKKQLIRLLFERVRAELGIQPEDLEITITETPRHNWGIRGVPGDELGLSYKVTV
jgi:phenylpyruvate tautomerase PptA (4-oxalocrotonate tautomerase family)